MLRLTDTADQTNCDSPTESSQHSEINASSGRRVYTSCSDSKKRSKRQKSGPILSAEGYVIAVGIGTWASTAIWSPSSTGWLTDQRARYLRLLIFSFPFFFSLDKFLLSIAATQSAANRSRLLHFFWPSVTLSEMAAIDAGRISAILAEWSCNLKCYVSCRRLPVGGVWCWPFPCRWNVEICVKRVWVLSYRMWLNRLCQSATFHFGIPVTWFVLTRFPAFTPA